MRLHRYFAHIIMLLCGCIALGDRLDFLYKHDYYHLYSVKAGISTDIREMICSAILNRLLCTFTLQRSKLRLQPL